MAVGKHRSRQDFLSHGFMGLAFSTALGLVLAAGATIGLWWYAGFEPMLDRLLSVRWYWLVAALAGQVVAYLGYMLAYREAARVDKGPEFRTGDLAALVSTGFGLFVPKGGFSADLEALRHAGVPTREARVRILGLGALEYAVLAPAACVASVYLIVRFGGEPSLSLTLPWAVGVPLGFALAAIALIHRNWFRNGGAIRRAICHGIDAVDVVRKLAVHPWRHGLAFVGMAVYWLGDIFCLWAALHAFTAGTPRASLLVVGYASGYALTRRTLPLAGAGLVEALLPFSLAWVGIALVPALLAVGAYRTLNLWLPLIPAAMGLRLLRTRSIRARLLGFRRKPHVQPDGGSSP